MDLVFLKSQDSDKAAVKSMVPMQSNLNVDIAVQ